MGFGQAEWSVFISWWPRTGVKQALVTCLQLGREGPPLKEENTVKLAHLSFPHLPFSRLIKTTLSVYMYWFCLKTWQKGLINAFKYVYQVKWTTTIFADYPGRLFNVCLNVKILYVYMYTHPLWAPVNWKLFFIFFFIFYTVSISLTQEVFLR